MIAHWKRNGCRYCMNELVGEKDISKFEAFNLCQTIFKFRDLYLCGKHYQEVIDKIYDPLKETGLVAKRWEILT